IRPHIPKARPERPLQRIAMRQLARRPARRVLERRRRTRRLRRPAAALARNDPARAILRQRPDQRLLARRRPRVARRADLAPMIVSRLLAEHARPPRAYYGHRCHPLPGSSDEPAPRPRALLAHAAMLAMSPALALEDLATPQNTSALDERATTCEISLSPPFLIR